MTRRPPSSTPSPYTTLSPSTLTPDRSYALTQLSAADTPFAVTTPDNAGMDCNAMSCVTAVENTVSAAEEKKAPPTHWLGYPPTPLVTYNL